MFKNLTIGKKIGLGFGCITLMLVIVAAFSYSSASDMADTIPGKILDGNLAQKEVDHLNWAKQVSELLTDESVTTLSVQTDDHKCAFGEWLYGEGRKQAEREIPAIAPYLKEIESYHAALHESAIEIGDHFQQADALLPGKLCAREVDHLVWADEVNKLFLENLPELDVQTDPNKCAFGKWLNSDEAQKAAQADPKFASLLEAVKEPHRHLHESAIEIKEHWQPAHPGLIETLMGRLDDHRRWAGKVCRACVQEDATFEVETDPTKCAFGKFLQSDECKQWCAEYPELKTALDACDEPHRQLHASAVKIKEAFMAGDVAAAKKVYDEETAPSLDAVAKHFTAGIEAEQTILAAQQKAREVYETQTLPALAKTRECLGDCQQHASAALTGMTLANDVYATKTKPNLEKTQALLNKIRDEIKKQVMTDEAMLAASHDTKRNVSIVGIATVIVAALLAFFISRGIIQTLTRIITGLNEGADQVNDAASQVSSASQQLAEGASEQASSLEETSAALEEMAAMTRTNAENAKQADELSNQARAAAQTGDQTMHQLNSAMTGINESSEKISKIIKVIEEIAFQTNLLALNAAVEAARAGEHGKGFAVVADEVRNLAQRAAAAAGDTTTLIEDSVNKAQSGTAVAGEVGTALGTIVSDVTKVTDLINGIAKASEEQAQGVDQVNTAVSQMDKVTQQNASGAEESASAAEELSAQASTVKAMIDELRVMVGGSADTKHRRRSSVKHEAPPQTASSAAHKQPVHAGATSSTSESFMDMDGDESGMNNF